MRADFARPRVDLHRAACFHCRKRRREECCSYRNCKSAPDGIRRAAASVRPGRHPVPKDRWCEGMAGGYGDFKFEIADLRLEMQERQLREHRVRWERSAKTWREGAAISNFRDRKSVV